MFSRKVIDSLQLIFTEIEDFLNIIFSAKKTISLFFALVKIHDPSLSINQDVSMLCVQ